MFPVELVVTPKLRKAPSSDVDVAAALYGQVRDRLGRYNVPREMYIEEMRCLARVYDTARTGL